MTFDPLQLAAAADYLEDHGFGKDAVCLLRAAAIAAQTKPRQCLDALGNSHTCPTCRAAIGWDFLSADWVRWYGCEHVDGHFSRVTEIVTRIPIETPPAGIVDRTGPATYTIPSGVEYSFRVLRGDTITLTGEEAP